MGMVIVSALVCVYYNVIVAWTIYYLFLSLRAVLPWSSCGNVWNTENCFDGKQQVTIAANTNISLANISSLNMDALLAKNFSLVAGIANSSKAIVNISNLVSSSEEFWE